MKTIAKFLVVISMQNDDPEDLLLNRLLLLQKENDELRQINKLWQDFCYQYEDAYKSVVDMLPEPVILMEILELITDPQYRSYLMDTITIIDRQKMWLAVYEETTKERLNNG